MTDLPCIRRAMKAAASPPCGSEPHQRLATHAALNTDFIVKPLSTNHRSCHQHIPLSISPQSAFFGRMLRCVHGLNKTGPGGDEAGLKDRRRLWGRSTQPCSMQTMPEAAAANLVAKQSPRNHRRNVSWPDRRMAERPRTILDCPDVDFAVTNVVVTFHDLAGITWIIGTLTRFGSHALRVRRGLCLYRGPRQRRNRPRVFVGSLPRIGRRWWLPLVPFRRHFIAAVSWDARNDRIHLVEDFAAPLVSGRRHGFRVVDSDYPADRSANGGAVFNLLRYPALAVGNQLL